VGEVNAQETFLAGELAFVHAAQRVFEMKPAKIFLKEKTARQLWPGESTGSNFPIQNNQAVAVLLTRQAQGEHSIILALI